MLKAFPRSRPYRHPSLFFSAHISARCPHDLNARNRLMFFIGLPGTRSFPTNREGQERETKPQELVCMHEVNLPSETLKEKTHSMANLFSFLLPLCAFVNLGLLIFLSDSSGPLHLLSLCGQEKNNYYTRPRFNRGK